MLAVTKRPKKKTKERLYRVSIEDFFCWSQLRRLKAFILNFSGFLGFYEKNCGIKNERLQIIDSDRLLFDNK
jgi:hypothetical protein